MSSTGQQSSTPNLVPFATEPIPKPSKSQLAEVDLGIKSTLLDGIRDISRKKYAGKLMAAWRDMPQPSDFQTDERLRAALEQAEVDIEIIRSAQDNLPSWNILSARNFTKQLERRIKGYKVYSSSEPANTGSQPATGDHATHLQHHQSTPSWGSAPPPSLNSAPTYLNPGAVSQGPPPSSAALPMASMDSPFPFPSESQPRTPTASGSSPHRPMFDAEALVVPHWQGPDADGGSSASPLPTHHPVFQAEMATTSGEGFRKVWSARANLPEPNLVSQGYPSSSTASMDSPFPYHLHSRAGNWQDANGERRLIAPPLGSSTSPPTPYPGFQGEMAPTFGSSPPQAYGPQGEVFYGVHGAPSAPTTVSYNYHTHNYRGPTFFPGASGQRNFNINQRSANGNYHDMNGGALTITPSHPAQAMVTNGLPGSPPNPLSDSPTEETSIPHVKPLPDGDERLFLFGRVAEELSQSAALPDLADDVVCDLRGLVNWLKVIPVETGKRVRYLSRKDRVDCGQLEEVARYVSEACSASTLPSFSISMGLDSNRQDCAEFCKSIVPRIADGLYESFPAFRRAWETTYPNAGRPRAYLNGTFPGVGVVASKEEFKQYISRVFDCIPEAEMLPILVLIIGFDTRSSFKMREHVNGCMLDCMRSTHMLFIVAGKESLAVQTLLQEMRSTSLGISVT
ncbi:hypothetical protein D9611_010812 [Ephemerocybe angulata]|uniref:Uncharacterized protein n=1 Tax=Ephemerocybe angulata TaxID=980116 RepID=A0A8H5BCN3_9AGAR|nr:hypothetical protein D9611_010812 [Tulosesus angulatus]